MAAMFRVFEYASGEWGWMNCSGPFSAESTLIFATRRSAVADLRRYLAAMRKPVEVIYDGGEKVQRLFG